jgi:uncharacterized SAM-binding protein YcdF (DUF218 family)
MKGMTQLNPGLSRADVVDAIATTMTPVEVQAASLLGDAELLWSFHQVQGDERPTDVAIVLGSHDIGVAEHAADLYNRGRFPLVVFTGANAPTTIKEFPRGEAVQFAERAEELGVPRSAILVEPRATNTSENITFTRELLAENGIVPASATLISKPYQQRRAWATMTKVWPEVEIVCSARTQSLTDYIASIGDVSRVLSMLVGDTQRLWIYADRGHAAEVHVPEDVAAAYHRLVDAGYTTRLIPAHHDWSN